MAQLSKVLKVVCWAGSVPFPPGSLQRQVVCLTVAAGVHVFSSLTQGILFFILLSRFKQCVLGLSGLLGLNAVNHFALLTAMQSV